jgi:predicted TIM-barrel fold metal-dependent hydrolase
MTGQVVFDTCVHPFFSSESELREFMAAPFRDRGWPNVERPYYQAPGGDYREDLYGEGFPFAGGYPGSDPDTVARHVLDDAGVDVAILNPLTRGNLPDWLLNSAICAAINEWQAQRWLTSQAARGRFRATIRVNPEDPVGAVQEIERWADHPQMVQVGVPLQSREPYGKPQFQPIWEAAAAAGLPVAVHITGGAGIEYPPTPAGHARTYPHYAAYMPLNYFHHLASLITDGAFSRNPDLVFVFADGGIDILTPLIWRLDTFWRSMRDQTPWVDRYPSEYLRDHVRFCFEPHEGPTASAMTSDWLALGGKEDLLMFASNYPYWSTVGVDALPAELSDEQRAKILGATAAQLYGRRRPTREGLP